MVDFKISKDIHNLYVHDASLDWIKFDFAINILEICMTLPELDSPEDMKECIIRFYDVVMISDNVLVNELEWENYSSNVLGINYRPELNHSDLEGCCCEVHYSAYTNSLNLGGGEVIFLTSGYDIEYL